MKKLSFLLILAAAFTSLQAQTNEASQALKNVYTYKLMQWENPWLGWAAAGMQHSAQSLDKIGSMSDFSAYAKLQNGEFKDYWQGSTVSNYGFETSSYMRLGKIFLHGRFNYDYGMDKDVQWRGWINPGVSPYMLADSVKGNFALEQYNMEASAAFPLGRSWTMGLEAFYSAFSGAKHKDLRNKNTLMDFRLRPSIMWHSPKASIAIEGRFGRFTENVSYTQVETNTNKTLFYLMGMWFNTNTVYTTTTPKSRTLRNLSLGASLQWQLNFGDVKVFSSTSIDKIDQSNMEDAVSPEYYGNIGRTEIAEHLVLQWKLRHRLTLDAVYTEDMGNKPVQRQELNEKSRLYDYVVYDWIHNYSQTDLRASARYHYQSGFEKDRDLWEAWAGVDAYRWERSYSEPPMEFAQDCNYLQAVLGGRYTAALNKGRLEFSPEAAYGFADGKLLDETATSDVQTLEPTALWQISEGLQNEFDFAAADRISASLQVRYARFLNTAKGLTFFVSLKYGFVKAISGGMEGESRQSAGVSVGITF